MLRDFIGMSGYLPNGFHICSYVMSNVAILVRRAGGLAAARMLIKSDK